MPSAKRATRAQKAVIKRHARVLAQFPQELHDAITAFILELTGVDLSADLPKALTRKPKEPEAKPVKPVRLSFGVNKRSLLDVTTKPSKAKR